MKMIYVASPESVPFTLNSGSAAILVHLGRLFIKHKNTIDYRLCKLTLKAPNKNCSRRHFNFLLLSFALNNA